MSLGRHVTFANVASATALTLVLGGGVAVAAGLAPNSVGSKQIKAQAVKSSDLKNGGVKGKDIKNDAVTGKQVNESTLGPVPSVRSVRVGARVTSAVGAPPAVMLTQGPFTVSLRCVDGGGGVVAAHLEIRTSVDNAAMDATTGESYPDFDVFLGPRDIAETASATPDLSQAFVTAITPAGQLLQGYGYVGSKLSGATGCSAQMTFFG